MSAVLIPTLDPKHKKFADEFLRTNRKAASAVAAGYSPNSSHTEASRLLKRPDIAEYIAHHAAKMTEQRQGSDKAAEVLGNRVLQELEALAFANITDFITIDKDGKPSVDFSNATPEQLRAITSIKSKVTKRFDGKGKHVATDAEHSFNMADKYRGLELLGKHLGLFKADEQRVVVDVADRLLNARRRVMLADTDREEN